MKIGKLTWARRESIDAEIATIDTGEIQAVLSNSTLKKIMQGVPVSYRSAALYCKARGLDPQEIILKQRKIPIIEVIEDEMITA